MTDCRLASGGLVDRAVRIPFSFDGRSLDGLAGDTLASALLANGVHLAGRSFKYHRPRGIMTAGPEEPNALVELRTGARREPNTRATVAELYDGLAATSQNRFPSLGFDLLAINGLLSPILAAGFYYKTFMWPASFWERLYEPLIRRAAGLGRAAGLPDPDTYEKSTCFADLLVIGGGPAGLTAALQAGRAGQRVVLAEQDFALGGRLLSDRRSIDGQPAAAWLAATTAELAGLTGVRLLTRCTVTGIYDGGTYAAVERLTDHRPDGAPGPRQRLWHIVAPRAVLASGAIERPLVFGGNDLPGILLAGAVRSYINRFAVRPGTRAVVFANNDDAARTIRDLVDSGIAVVGVVDPRETVPQAVADAAESAGARLFAGATVRQATGRLRVQRVLLGGRAAGTMLECDLLAVSGGWSPAVHLASNHGGKPVWNEAIAGFVPGEMPPGLSAVGAAAGRFLLADSVPTITTDAESAAIQPLWNVPDALGKSFVDFQNDVTAGDIALAAREGFVAVEHLKRYTTLGMATDQGKTANVNGLAIMAALTGRSIAQTGTTVFRPPYTPTAIGVFAGHHRGPQYKPVRLTPAHDWAAGAGAVFIEAGEWMRAQAFPRPGDDGLQRTIDREVLAVRNACGFCDVSTLGKIDVQGPDSAAFLDLLYVNAMATLPVGRVRYGMMLREDGFAFDDGTVARLSPTHFVVTTSTGQAGAVFRHMEFCRQIVRPELDVCVEPVSDQWAQVALAGPRARDVLQAIVDPATDVGNSAFPYMATIEAILLGDVSARLFRISFSGELAYEIAVPARHGAALAERLMQAGAAFRIVPYGLEALNVLRLEKGHLVAAELNGQTTAADLGLGRMASKTKDFIGRAMAQRPALVDPDRPSLVGLRPCQPGASLQAGAHLLPQGAPPTAANDQGYVTSAAYSATLGHWIGLALLADGSRRLGETLRACSPLQGIDTAVEIVPRAFYDPAGQKLHV